MDKKSKIPLLAALNELLGQIHPGSVVERVTRLDQDTALEGEATEKATGYGLSLRVVARDRSGARRSFVFHTANANDFDHDRRSDRAKNILLAYDTFQFVPKHVAALDVGAISEDGSLRSLRNTGEFYLLTDFAEGSVYAEDLRRIALEKRTTDRDRSRCEALAAYLCSLHARKEGRPALYTRSIRNLVGNGEGVFGIIDGYPADVPAAPPERLQAIEARCVKWRWRLRGREGRVARIHGDFHPFNILFDDEDNLSLLDASRGCHGDPADDVTCLAINYLFFALERKEAWLGGLRDLWQRFWSLYLDETGDRELLEVAPPYLSWRALVLANPAWYPQTHETVRDALLRLVEGALDEGAFDPRSAERLFS